MIVENSQIQRAVDLQRRMNCEMQLNVVLNVHVGVHSSTFQRNKTCILLSEHSVCVLYTVDMCVCIYIYINTHTLKRTPIALSSVKSHFRFHIFLQTCFKLNQTFCEDHTSNSDNVTVQNLKSCLNCAQLCNLHFEIHFKVSFKSISSLSACSVTGFSSDGTTAV